eukprot:jgi/Botrbrau1/6141/Bobra.331_2s0034.1
MVVLDLWECQDVIPWQESLTAASDRVKSLGKDKLIELDQWFFDVLPGVIRERRVPSLEVSEVVRLVDWKLNRGKWRPRLLDFAKKLDEAEVQLATSRAFTLVPPDPQVIPAPANVKEAIDTLSELKGIGPATATAILTAANPSVPFLSDEAMAAAVGGKKEYTVKSCIAVLGLLRDKAKLLSQTSEEAWTAKDVERAIYSAAIASKGQPKTSGKGKQSSQRSEQEPRAKRRRQ